MLARMWTVLRDELDVTGENTEVNVTFVPICDIYQDACNLRSSATSVWHDLVRALQCPTNPFYLSVSRSQHLYLVNDDVCLTEVCSGKSREHSDIPRFPRPLNTCKRTGRSFNAAHKTGVPSLTANKSIAVRIHSF